MDSGKKRILHVLHVEDSPGDAAYIKEILAEDKSCHYRVKTAELLSEGLEYLTDEKIDIILLDLSLPDSRGLDTFLTIKNAAPDLPVIIMTGLADENLAVRAVKEGAQDYLLKNRVDADLLVRSIRYAIEREKLKVKLQEAFEQIKILQGLLPICSHCKNIRDDRGFWHQVEEYVSTHSEAQFTHGICPVCMKKYYPEFSQDVDQDQKSPDKDEINTLQKDKNPGRDSRN
ncbi:MAG: response regulator [Desulfobulbaceae bacterium]|nr:response regulator [Desulfobulbaceae bacterium]